MGLDRTAAENAAKFLAFRARKNENQRLEGEVLASLNVARTREAIRKERKKLRLSYDEATFLETYVANLRSSLRPADEDGVLPPDVFDTQRVYRMDAHHGRMNGEKGPKNLRLVNLRVWALLLIQYQHKLTRMEALAFLSNLDGSRMSVLSLRTCFVCYATDAEMAYNPYGKKAPLAADVEAELKTRKLRVVWELTPSDVVNTRMSMMLVCEAGLGHRNSRISFGHVWYQGMGCRTCDRLKRKA